MAPAGFFVGSPSRRAADSAACVHGPGGLFRGLALQASRLLRCRLIGAFTGRGCSEGLPVPREPGYGSKRSHDQSACGGSVPGEAQRTCRERRAGCPTRTSGDGALAAPSATIERHRLKTCATWGAAIYERLQPAFGCGWMTGTGATAPVTRLRSASIAGAVKCSMARSNRTLAPGANGTTRPCDSSNDRGFG